MRLKNFLFPIIAILALAGCPSKGDISPHAQLTENVEPLRSAFNEDVGQVRVLMLVAPT
jgi:hypothetical protein